MDPPPLLPSTISPPIHADRFCPIANISFEILSHILSLAELSFRSDFAPFVCTPATCALSFTRVCRFWYAVALKTPMLWTSVDVMSEKSVGLAQGWVKRALREGLRVDVRVGTHGAGVEGATAYQFLEDHLERLERFAMEVTTPHNPRYAWPMRQNRLVSLELTNVWTSFQNLCSLLRLSPALQSLTVARSHDRPRVSSFFSQALDDTLPEPSRTALTQLRLDSSAISQEELCQFLALCPRLQYLSLSFSTSFLPIANELPRVELPALVGASLPIAVFTERLVEHWRAPSLQLTTFGRPASCAELHDSLTRERCSLSTTHVMDFTTDRGLTLDRRLWYLSHSAHITRLIIIGCSSGLDAIFALLCTPYGYFYESYDVPHLRELALVACKSPGHLEYFEGRYAYASRYSCDPPPLRRVYVMGCPELEGVASLGTMLEGMGTKVEVSLELPDETDWGWLFPEDDP